ncbi:MAG: hypothetical protein HUJ76_12975, partial [Parasporobacterium sp.]|nr:hypothetical protein [Parasporobacterium sp.]
MSINPCPEPVKECPDVEFCIPFGGHVSFIDGCIEYSEGTPPPDGVYDQIVIADGCIISAKKALSDRAPQTVCANTPAPCYNSDAPEPSPVPGNLYTLDSTGKPLVLVYIQGGTGTTVTGMGTSASPYIINAAGGKSSIYLQSTNSSITVAGDGSQTNPFKLTHVKTLPQAETYEGFSFDDRGHLTSYTQPIGTQSVKGILAGYHTKVSQIPEGSGIFQIALDNPYEGQEITAT